jgi:hypothetical protein
MTRFVFRTLLAVALGCVLSLSGAVMHMAPHRIQCDGSRRSRSRDAALDILPFRQVRQIIDARGRKFAFSGPFAGRRGWWGGCRIVRYMGPNFSPAKYPAFAP